MTSHRLLGAIYLALSVAMIAWDILMAGRIVQLRRTPRAFQRITGIAALLLEGRQVFSWLITFAPRRHRSGIDQTAREMSGVVLAYMRVSRVETATR